MADLNPTQGHEQAGVRPILVLSTDRFNMGPAGLVYGLPLTHTDRGLSIHVRVDPPEGGVDAPSFVLCEGLRSLAKTRLRSKRGSVTNATVIAVEARLRLLLGME